ncbi:MAG: hypothetical protein MK137_10055 [Rickettsiales bacterium]|nr:hypothetical protein [Rickettsiales bacterium]
MTAFNGIKKYPSSDYLREPNEEYWFKMKGNDASINNAFIIDDDKILVTIFGYTYASYNHTNKDKQKRDYEINTYLFDQSRQAFWLVDNVALGMVAVSHDQEERRVIYNDTSDQKLYELYIQKNL